MNVQEVMLSETSQSQNDKYYMISTYIRLSKIIESLSQNHRKQKVEWWLLGAGEGREETTSPGTPKDPSLGAEDSRAPEGASKETSKPSLPLPRS